MNPWHMLVSLLSVFTLLLGNLCGRLMDLPAFGWRKTFVLLASAAASERKRFSPCDLAFLSVLGADSDRISLRVVTNEERTLSGETKGLSTLS